MAARAARPAPCWSRQGSSSTTARGRLAAGSWPRTPSWQARRSATSAATPSAAARDAGQAAAAPEPPAVVSPSTDVSAAVAAACARLGRPYAAGAVAALQENWFSTAGELIALSDETARSLGVPLRLKATVEELVAAGVKGGAAQQQQQQQQKQQEQQDQLGGGLTGSLISSAVQLPGAAARLLGGLMGGGSSALPAAAAAEPVAQRDAGAAALQADEACSGSSDSEGGDGDELAAAVAGSVRRFAAAAGEDADQLALPIEERRCPLQRRAGNAFASAVKVSKRGRAERYALSDEEMSDALRAEFADLRRFLTVRFFGAQSEPISETTAAKYADHMRGLLGYVHRERGVPLDQLSFKHALPSSAREGVAVVFEYVLWLQDTRKISVRTEGLVVRSAAAAAKFLYHGESKVNPGQGERPYSDLGIVKEFRAMANTAKRQERVAPRVADEELKWLSWPEYLQLCAELRRECAGRDSTGRRRSDAAVAWSLQRYLIFAIFSCVPDRQRTLRELEVGRTLVKDREGRWVIRHGPGDYKTGRSYGERPPLVIAEHVYPELEAWMGKWRACLQPKHGLLFTQQNGEPLTDKSLYKLFWTTSYRLTGKKCNPHLIRDSIVTYLRGSGASERELEALALYMGHSVDMQRSTYDRRSKEQKVEPAVELLASLNRRAIGGGGGSSSDGEASA